MADAGVKIAIGAQIAEVKRELALRRNVYPGLVRNGKMKPAEAELCTDRMKAVLKTLEFCELHEFQIRDYIAARGQAVAE
jgi:hypothetical protein